jgi:hypothetical protein
LKLFVLLCHAWCVWLLVATKLARLNGDSLEMLVHPDHRNTWSFDDRTWSGIEFDDGRDDPSQAFRDISAIGAKCDKLRHLSSMMLIGQAVLCLQYFVHIDPRLAIITESIRVPAPDNACGPFQQVQLSP